MATQLLTAIAELPYYFRGTYAGRTQSLRKHGIDAIQFTDVDIHELVTDSTELKFYKETLLEKPRQVCFTIYQVRQNRVVVELHVNLDKKEISWHKPRTRWNMPNLSVKLKIIQDSSKQQWVGSEQV